MTSVTDEHRLEAKQRLLTGLVRGDDVHGMAADVADLHVRHNTFPGEVFMAVAADAAGGIIGTDPTGVSVGASLVR